MEGTAGKVVNRVRRECDVEVVLVVNGERKLRGIVGETEGCSPGKRCNRGFRRRREETRGRKG